jgi:uncharacterized protein (DUF58 family)
MELISRRLLTGDLVGEYRSAFHGSGLQFKELKEYTPGSDARFIDWKASSRLGRTVMRSFEEERERTIMLVVDSSSSMGTSHLKGSVLQLIALLTALAQIHHDRVGLIRFSHLVHDVAPPRNSRTHLRKLTHRLGLCEWEGRTDLTIGLDALRQNLKRKSLVFIFSDLLTECPYDSVRALAKRHELIFIVPLSCALPQPASGSLVRVVDSESGAYQIIDYSRGRVRQTLADSHLKIYQNKMREVQKLGAIAVTLDADPLHTLFQIIKAQKNRRC